MGSEKIQWNGYSRRSLADILFLCKAALRIIKRQRTRMRHMTGTWECHRDTLRHVSAFHQIHHFHRKYSGIYPYLYMCLYMGGNGGKVEMTGRAIRYCSCSHIDPRKFMRDRQDSHIKRKSISSNNQVGGFYEDHKISDED